MYAYLKREDGNSRSAKPTDDGSRPASSSDQVVLTPKRGNKRKDDDQDRVVRKSLYELAFAKSL